MADAQAHISVNLDTSKALASIRALQAEISRFHQSQSALNAQAAGQAAGMQRNLINSINATGQFSAQMTTVASTTGAFTRALETNKLSLGQYFKYGVASTKTFGRVFRSEFDTINRVARERVKTLQTQYIKMGRDANGAMRAIAVRPLALDMQNLATRTAVAAQRQALFNQLLRQGSTSLLNWGKNTQWAGRQLMVGFTLPLTLFGSVAARTFMDLEEQAIRFKRVYGELFTSQQETDNMYKELQGLGSEFTKYGVALKDTMKMAADAAAMGKTGADLMAQVRQAATLAVLGGVEQDKALETTISLTNAFGVSAEQLAGKIDFLNAVENQTVVSIEDLTTAIPKAGPVVQQLGGDVEDLAFFLTAMKEGGINASEGANALKSGLARIINPTERASEMLAGLGININGIVEGNAGDVKGTIVALATALDTLDPLNKARAIEELFGKFQFARISTLMQNVIKEGSQAERVLQLTAASAEELAVLSERELKRVESSPLYKFKQAVEDLKIELAPVGEEFLKAVTPIIEFGTTLLKKFNEMGEGPKRFTIALTAILGVIAPTLLMIIGLVGNGIANIGLLIATLGRVGSASAGMNSVATSTQYMTTAQLQAESAAMALGQSHASLTPIFTSETAAVRALTLEYEKGIIAQRAFMGAGGVKGGKGGSVNIPKAATGGIISGPGTGTSDSILAMVSNGEAIIPAESVKKNPGIIAQLIQDNIPGYADGKYGVGSWYKAPEFLRLQKNQQSWDTMEAERKASEAAMRRLNANRSLSDLRTAGSPFVNQRQIEQMLNTSVSHIKPDTRSVNIGGIPDSQKIWRTPNLMTDWQGSMNQLSNALDETNKSSKANAVLQKEAIQYEKDALKAAEEDKSLTKKERDTRKREIRATFKKMRSGQAITTSGQAKVLQDFLKKTNEKLLKTATDKTLPKGVRKAAAQPLSYTMATQAVLDERLSSKVAPGRGFYETLKERKYSDPKGKALAESNRQLAKAQENVAKANKNKAKTEEKTAKETARKTNQQRRTAKSTPTRARPLPAPTARTLALLGEAGVAKAIAEGKDPNRVAAGKSSQMARAAAKMPAVPVEEPVAPKQRAAGPRVGATGVAGVAAMAAVGGSFAGGKIGEISQQLLMPAMLLPMFLPMLQKGFMKLAAATGGKGPAATILAVLAAIASLAIGASLAKKKLEEQVKETYKLQTALSGTTESMIEFGEFSGKVTSTEIMDKMYANQIGTFRQFAEGPTFGESFVGSDAGTAMVDNLKNGLAKLGRSGTMQSITDQMTTAIISGALDIGQAKSIVSALGQELNDYNLSIQINGQINSLFGPNGENLLEGPLEVAIKAAEQRSSNITAAMRYAGPNIEQATMSPEEIDAKAAEIAKQQYDALVENVKAEVAKEVEKYGAGPGDIEYETLFSEKMMSLVGGMGTFDEYLKTNAEAIKTGISADLYQEYVKQVENASIRLASILPQISSALQSNAASLDALDVYYFEQIDLAKMEGDFDKAAELEQDRLDARQEYLDASKEIYDQFNKLVSLEVTDESGKTTNLGKKARGIINTMATEYAAADPLTKALNEQIMADSAISDINKAKLQQGAFIDKTIGIDALNSLYMGLSSDATVAGEQIDRFLNLNVSLGGRDTAEVYRMASLFVDEDGNPIEEQQTKFIASFEGKDQAEVQRMLERSRLGENVGSVMTYGTDVSTARGQEAGVEYSQTPAGKKAIDDALDFKEKVESELGNEPITMDFITEHYGDDIAAIAEDDFEGLSKLPAEQQLTYLASAQVALSMTGDPDMIAAYKDWQTRNPYGTWMEFVNDQFNIETYTTSAVNPDVDPPEATGTGSSKEKGSWLDEIVKSSRNFGNAGQQLTQGWEDSLNAIMNMVDGVAWATNGLGRQLRSANVPETLIEKFLGMEPEEWEKTKKELFDDVDGKLQLNAKGTQVMKAYGSSVIADKRGEIESETKATENQIDAFNKLRRQGMSVSEAFDMIQDKKVADAIATSDNTEEVKKLIAAQRELTKAQEEYQEISEQQRISEAVRGINKDFAEQAQIVSKLAAAGAKYSEAQISSILSNKDIGKLFLNPSIDKKALETALANANKQADLELKIKKLTVTGQEDIFQTGLSAAMSAFSAKEQEIELNFKVNIADDQALVDTAQEQISKIEFELDDYQAAIQELDWAEQEINKAYEKRFESLDRIREVNDQIAASQQKQLDLADALSRGDIAAAAKAAQDMRSQQQQDALETQRRMMETAQQTEIQRLRSTTGMTREQLEAKILELEKQRFGIEENTLEPAQERIRLAELAKDAQITDLEVLGKTRDAWDRIANSVDLAQANGYRFAEAMQESLNIVETLIYNYLNKPVPPPPPPPPAPSGGNNYKWEGEMAGPAGRAARAKARAEVQARKKERGTLASGGMVKGYSFGGMVARFAAGGYSLGSDTIPAMLTPGEFVVRRPAVNAFGVDNLESINRGTYDGNSVYNYNLAVNVKSDANPNEIANTVMRSIKQVEGRRIRGNSYNG